MDINVNGGTGWLALVILIIFFWGEPDLIDALIQFLTEN